MKQSLHFLLIAICFQLFSFNQKALALSGGPDSYGYIWKDSNEPGGPVYSWIDIAGFPGVTQVSGLSDDNVMGPFGVGFNFPFYWYTVSNFWVGSNGYIGFNNVGDASPFDVIPLGAAPNNFIAPMKSDLNFENLLGTNPAKCYYWKNAANDTLIVSWVDVPFWVQSPGTGNLTGANTFQVILSTVDSSITFQYKLQTGIIANPLNSMTIGIENISGAIGLQHSHDTYPVANYAVKYFYPSNTTFQVSDASTLWNSNTESAGVFLEQGTTPYNLKTHVKNTGNQPLASFPVFSRVLNAANVASATNTANTTGTLAPAATESFNHPIPFIPSNDGTYRYITTTQLAGDATPSNNSVTQEIVVVDTTLTSSVELAYCDDVNDGNGISWQGGAAGVGVYFKPPFHPFKIEKLSYFIVANPNDTGFYAQVYIADGPGGTGGTLLIDSLIDSTQINFPAWNHVVLTNPIVVYDTAVYMSWFMQGGGIAVGQDTTRPFSYNNYEILGGAWATYRTNEFEDLMLKMTISPIPDTSSGIGFAEYSLDKWKVSPNPFNENIVITATGKDAEPIKIVTIYDISGRMVFAQKIFSGGRIVLSPGNLSQGIYTLNIKGEMSERNIKMVKNQ